MTTEVTRRAPGQWRSLLRASHPKQAVVLALGVGGLVALMDRAGREVAASAAAVLVAQLVMGLVNDLCDADLDRRAEAPGKPIAAGDLPPGNASFAVAVLLLLVIPLSLQNGIVAGLALLATLVVGVLHNRWLHRGLLSWVGWVATFVLLGGFVTYGGWGAQADGYAPVGSFVGFCAALGLLVHLLVALPDLVTDDRAGVRNLPLRIARRTGATRLLVVTGLATAVVLAVGVWQALTVGIAA